MTLRTEPRQPFAFFQIAVLQRFYLSILVAICAGPMRRFGAASIWLQHIRECPVPDIFTLIAGLLSIPCFEVSHFFFKIAYMLNQRRLMLLCSKDFFLEFYDRRVASGRVIDVLQSLRHIECGLEGANAHNNLARHDTPPIFGTSEDSEAGGEQRVRLPAPIEKE